MTTTSYPARGLNGLNEVQWAAMYASEDGIVEDYHASGVEACTLTRSGDTATVGVGKVKVNGYTLDITAAHTLSLPAVSSTTVYYICAMYDPALNVELADGSGNASPDGPCRLVVSSGPPSTAGGKSYTGLYRVTRNPGDTSLSVATVEDVRVWKGPLITMVRYPASGQGTGFGPWPRGTVLVLADFTFSLRTPNAAGSALTWVNMTTPPALALPFPTGLKSHDDAPSTPQIVPFSGRGVMLRGSLDRSSGANLSTGIDVVLATMPVGFRPAFVQRWLCKVGPGKNYAEVRIGSDGIVTMTDPGTSCTWIDLSPISYRAEN